MGKHEGWTVSLDKVGRMRNKREVITHRAKSGGLHLKSRPDGPIPGVGYRIGKATSPKKGSRSRMPNVANRRRGIVRDT